MLWLLTYNHNAHPKPSEIEYLSLERGTWSKAHWRFWLQNGEIARRRVGGGHLLLQSGFACHTQGTEGHALARDWGSGDPRLVGASSICALRDRMGRLNWDVKCHRARVTVWQVLNRRPLRRCTPPSLGCRAFLAYPNTPLLLQLPHAKDGNVDDGDDHGGAPRRSCPRSTWMRSVAGSPAAVIKVGAGTPAHSNHHHRGNRGNEVGRY